MSKKLKIIFLTFIAMFSMAFVPTYSYAAVPCEEEDANFLSFPNWNRGLMCETAENGSTYTVIDDIPNFIWTVVLNGLDILLRIAGILAVVLLIFNSYMYLTSGGESDKVAKAKKGLLQAIVGLAIALLASAIIYFVIGWVA